jgi:hypothetical protein
MDQEYPIESAWRRLIVNDWSVVRSSVADRYADLVCEELGKYSPLLLHGAPPELLHAFLKPTGDRNLPPGVLLPSQLVRQLISFSENQGHGRDEIKQIREWALLIANTIHVWAAYRQEKAVYEVKTWPRGFTDFPERVLVRSLRLPSDSAIFSGIWEGKRFWHAVTYDFFINESGSGVPTLQFSHFDDDLWSPGPFLLLTQENIKGCIDESRALGGSNNVAWRDSSDWCYTVGGQILEIMARVNQTPAGIQVISKGGSAPEGDPDLEKDLARPTIYSFTEHMTPTQ